MINRQEALRISASCFMKRHTTNCKMRFNDVDLGVTNSRLKKGTGLHRFPLNIVVSVAMLLFNSVLQGGCTKSRFREFAMSSG